MGEMESAENALREMSGERIRDYGEAIVAAARRRSPEYRYTHFIHRCSLRDGAWEIRNATTTVDLCA
jgi:hypothetical protein